MIESLWDDVRYAVRNLRRDPFLALAATLTLAVCMNWTGIEQPEQLDGRLGRSTPATDGR
jgi:hypothetical protein